MGKILNKIKEKLGFYVAPSLHTPYKVKSVSSFQSTQDDRIEIVKEYPPIWDRVLASGMKPDAETIVFTYGNKIYIPSGKSLSDDLLVHEAIHTKQQNGKPDEWWDKYIVDTKFRFDQELEAYAE